LSPSAADDRSTIDTDEVARFSALADQWWDAEGDFAPLHKFNPVRLRFIRDQLCQHFRRDPAAERPLEGLRLLDIGCGGGLIAEPMARLGARVTGADASTRNIEVAKIHARRSGLDINYRVTTAEDLVAEGARFDVILNLEVVEHVAAPDRFIAACAELLTPGGLMVLATLNRTAKAFALAIVGAEYVLGWLPRGTHDWRKFVRPEELRAMLEQAGLRVDEPVGLQYSPLNDRWSLTSDCSVNYMMTAIRPDDGKEAV